MSMAWYVARRVGWAVVVAFLIVSITFGLLQLSPDPGLAQAKLQATQTGGDTQSAAQAYKQARGLNKPVWERYVNYIGNVATGHWGWSDTRSQPVSAAILDAYPFTLMYSVPSVIISTILGMGIGLYSATHQYTKSDYAATFFAFFGVSIPNFWFGIVLLLIFGVGLGWFPILFDPNLPTFSLANIKQLVLPVVVLTTSAMASEMRYARAESLEYVRATFVKTARAKGADSRRITFRHIFRPALVPLSTILVGDVLALLISSSVLVEVVFGIPGLGRLVFDAIEQQDTALVLGTTFIFVTIGVIGNLLQDLAYTVVDPRIDFSDR